MTILKRSQNTAHPSSSPGQLQVNSIFPSLLLQCSLILILALQLFARLILTSVHNWFFQIWTAVVSGGYVVRFSPTKLNRNSHQKYKASSRPNHKRTKFLCKDLWLTIVCIDPNIVLQGTEKDKNLLLSCNSSGTDSNLLLCTEATLWSPTNSNHKMFCSLVLKKR